MARTLRWSRWLGGSENTAGPLRIWRETLAAFLVFAVLTYLVYWPAFGDACCSVFVPLQAQLGSDVGLILWIFATVARSLASNPFDLFRGDALYPEPMPITGAEHMFSQQIFFAPLFLVSGNPVWSMQLTLFLNCTLCGVGMYLLLRHWKVAVPAAAFAGFVYAMFPSRYLGIHAPHVYAAQYLPLAVLFLDRSVDRRSKSDAGLFGLFLALQMLTSFYLAYISVVVIVVFSVGKIAAERRFEAGRWVFPVLAACCAGVLLVGTALPYLASASRGAFRVHERADLMMTSNSPWQSFLYPPIAIRRWRWPNFGMLSYLGLVPLALALVGCAGVRRPSNRVPVIGLLMVAVVTYLFSLGPPRSPDALIFGRPYEWAEAWLPGFSIMRVPSRFSAGVMLSVAALAGMGLHSVFAVAADRIRGRWWRYGVVVLLGAVVALEFGIFHFRMKLRQPPLGAAIPKVYRALERMEKGPVLEIPGGVLDGAFVVRESEYSYFNIFHRQPILNGFTGYRPPTYGLLMSLARALPDPHAVELLKRLTGLRYVVVHGGSLPPFEEELWREPPGMVQVGHFGRDVLFELPPSPADLAPALMRNVGEPFTVLGTSTEALDIGARSASITVPAVQPLPGVDEPLVLDPNTVRYNLRVAVENRSETVWPALSVDSARVVRWVFRWEENIEASWRPVGDEHWVPLAYDLAPGQKTATTLRVPIPPYRGLFRLVVGLAHAETWFPDPIVISDMAVLVRDNQRIRNNWRIKGLGWKEALPR